MLPNQEAVVVLLEDGHELEGGKARQIRVARRTGSDRAAGGFVVSSDAVLIYSLVFSQVVFISAMLDARLAKANQVCQDHRGQGLAGSCGASENLCARGLHAFWLSITVLRACPAL